MPEQTRTLPVDRHEDGVVRVIQQRVDAQANELNRKEAALTKRNAEIKDLRELALHLADQLRARIDSDIYPERYTYSDLLEETDDDAFPSLAPTLRAVLSSADRLSGANG